MLPYQLQTTTMNNTTLFNATLQATPQLLETGVEALLILLGGFLLGKLLGTLLKRLLRELSIDKNVNLFLNKRLSLERLLANTLSLLIYIVTIILFLKTLGILRPTALVVLLIAVVLIGISVLFSLVIDAVPNLYAGIVLSKKKYSPGKKIVLKNLKGTIKKRRMMSIVVDVDGDEIIIPNKRLLKKK